MQKTRKTKNESTEELKCCICMDNENIGNIKKTPCDHTFHLDCLKRLARPKCPLCNKNIMKFLVKNGVAKNEILKKIINDDYRIAHDAFIRERSLEEMDQDDIMTTAILAKKKTGDGWKEIYMDILTNIINHSRKEFYELLKLKNDGPSKEHGYLLLHCDLSVLIANLIDKYAYELVQWRTFDHIHNDGILSQYTENIEKMLDNGTYCLLIAVEDDFDNNETYMKHIIISNDDNLPLPGYESTLKAICDCEFHKQTDMNRSSQISDSEKDRAIKQIKNIKEDNDLIYDYEKTYRFLSDILLNEIEPLFDANTRNCSITLVTENDDMFHYTLFRRDGKYLYSLPDKGNKIIGNNISVSRYVHKRLDIMLAINLRFQQYNDVDKICQFLCLCDKPKSIVLKKFKPEIAKECMNTDSHSGKKILGLSCEEYM